MFCLSIWSQEHIQESRLAGFLLGVKSSSIPSDANISRCELSEAAESKYEKKKKEITNIGELLWTVTVSEIYIDKQTYNRISQRYTN